MHLKQNIQIFEFISKERKEHFKTLKKNKTKEEEQNKFDYRSRNRFFTVFGFYPKL